MANNSWSKAKDLILGAFIVSSIDNVRNGVLTWHVKIMPLECYSKHVSVHPIFNGVY